MKRFSTDVVELPTGEKQVVLHKKERGEQGRIVLCEEDIFDGIDEFHGKHGHMGIKRTWTACSAMFEREM